MTNSPYQLRVIVLWILLLAGMILHFNYHVSKIFYGIDVARPGANGEIPFMAHLLKNRFLSPAHDLHCAAAVFPSEMVSCDYAGREFALHRGACVPCFGRA